MMQGIDRQLIAKAEELMEEAEQFSDHPEIAGVLTKKAEEILGQYPSLDCPQKTEDDDDPDPEEEAQLQMILKKMITVYNEAGETFP